jgi:hypothetical protein
MVGIILAAGVGLFLIAMLLMFLISFFSTG